MSIGGVSARRIGKRAGDALRSRSLREAEAQRTEERRRTPGNRPAAAPAPASAPTSRPTVASARFGRAAHDANSGGGFRAFELQQRFDAQSRGLERGGRPGVAGASAPSPAPSGPYDAGAPVPTEKVQLLPEQQAAQEAYQRWSDPERLASDIAARGGRLEGFDDAELQALAALNIDQPQVRETIRDATLETVNGAETLDDVPSSVGFQHLLDTYVLNPEDEDRNVPGRVNAEVGYRAMVQAEVEERLDGALSGARGDDELEAAIDRFAGGLESLVHAQPAAGQLLERVTRDVFEENGQRFQDIQRADDAWYQDVGHAVTGAIRGSASWLADQIFPSAGAPSGGRFIGPFSDFFNHPAVQEAGRFGAGFNMAGHGAIEGIGELVADPVGSARALAEVVRNPSLLLEGYREAARAHGPSGALGAVGFDLMTAAVGAAATPTGLGAAALRQLGRVGRFIPDLPFGNRAARELLQDTRRLLDNHRFDVLPRGLQDDILRAVGRNPADVAGRQAITALVDSPGFGRLDLPEQERLVRYVGGENPHISGPARQAMAEIVNDPAFAALNPNEQAARLRRFVAEEPPSFIQAPPDGTFRPRVYAQIGEAEPIRHTFNSAGEVDARRYQIEIDDRTVEVIVPAELPDGVGHHHTLREMVDGLRAMPEANRRAVDRIVIEPAANPADGLYSSGVRAYMTAGADGTVSVYPSASPQSFDALASTMVHETGHVLSHRAWGSPSVTELPNGRFRFDYEGPQWERYREAADADGVLPSGYAATDIGEDVAEAARLYTVVRGTPFEAEIRAIFPNRFELLDELLGGGS